MMMIDMDYRTRADSDGAAAPNKEPRLQQDQDAAQDIAALPLSAREAASALGVSERTIRRAIQRGDLQAVKHSGSFHITPPSLEQYRNCHNTGQGGHNVLSHAATQDKTAAAARDISAAAQDTGQVTAEAVAVLRELLVEERRKSDALLESSLIWQTRALQLQERLAQLEAGPLVAPASAESTHAPVDALEPPGRADPVLRDDLTLRETHSEPVPTEVSLATAWRKWWRRVLGHEG